ncbi:MULTISPECIES: thiol reductant ABC exporter subunit CydD [Microbacterium]|uniref:Thiol reductant ABC exporter subunit CydD n=1 Tax=Microbacterium wangchenii TaxID=2541726 RepID=A0ABX5SWR9_9MICO|nr:MULTISPECIES: thiol reductant ABC exporter subunit CydD [Microbacterium]MCK6067386.1 thiol reductant ABC exporter subunit CydD [Microbacterium sp. EYE_512]QBR89676.1 thiol reductant ABC exporter subunit CydD [Microbacterium wangchenii]TFV81025.1 thiol reductant ABC exporter subunit CydD [Microbacterium sp. dk485]TXK16726.1 thiol reductant ABC exporter subunit CydD [Microbacterium wangchenii]
MSATTGTQRRRGPVDPRLLTYARASRGFLAVSAALVLAQTGVIVGFAWTLTSALVGAIEGTPVAELLPLLGAAAGLVLVRAILVLASERVSARGGAAASLQLRQALINAVGRLGPGWLGSRNAAALAVTAGHGLEALDAYFGRYLPQLVATALTTPLLIGAIALADPLSGLTVILTIPLIPLFMVLIGLATRAVQRRQYDTLGRLAARFADTVEGLGTLKAFGRDRRAADGIEEVTRRYKRETMAVLRVSFLSGFALEFLASISVAIVAVTIGFRLLAGDMELLVGLFVLLLAPEAYLPLRQVGVQFHAASEGVAATDEIFGVLDAAASAPAPAARPAGGSRIRTRGLAVRRGERMLTPVDLAIDPGRVTWLRGASGAGKSSVVAALLGFTPYEGEILVDDAVRADARDCIAWAGQRAGLVSGTVAANVGLGADDVDAALVRACLADAQAADIDPGLLLGAGGSGLSGGQAQRVAVARALYRLRSGDARVLVLDEPSSALDAGTEAALWRSIRGIADEGAGVLLVSHRASAASIADDVVTLAAPQDAAGAGIVADDPRETTDGGRS